MKKRMKVVIIGGVAAGPKTGSRIHRVCPEADITLVEKGEFLSYAGCGLPYYVSGIVKDQKELMCTPIGVVRDPVFFRDVKHVKVLNRTEALQIDRKKKEVRVKNLATGEEQSLPYDKCVLATGARPIIPPLEGIKLKNVFTLQSIEDSEGIKAALAEGKAKDAVIVGGGLIGIEMTEALASKGCRVTVVEKLPGILPMLDWEIARLVAKYLESHGVKIKTETTLTKIKGEKQVESVVTDRGEIPCDLLLVSIGVRPQTVLAQKAGLKIGVTGAIRVNERMQTSDPDIYAAGDCVETNHLITRKPCFIPLGSTANKQGRVAANNICGYQDVFPGVIGSTVFKVFDLNVGRTGLTEAQARKEGLEVVTVLSPAPDKAHFYPTAKPIMMKLVVERKTRRLLGVQIAGAGDVDKRIDAAAMAITAKMTVDDLANADLCYAPPYAPAMDNIIAAANVARNKLDGLFESLTPMEVKEKMARGDSFVFLDVRSPEEDAEARLKDSVLIPLGKLRARLKELPRDQEIITFCKISLRGYEAALILKAAGFKNVKVMDGGVMMWPYEVIQ
ncbi:MAG: FAD-dependent oxidoreductase [Candidatus Omnitrophica bacterium]|nr:FAD-dependent oxidoreductase [Candidatus Omnitrophota bacterium]